MKFIDQVSIKVSSGKGGAGAVSFRREAMVPRGGPDGGDGGHGGHVLLRTDARLHSLLDLRLQSTYRAEDGGPGQAQMRSGKKGEDLVLTVPPGTLIKDMDGQILYDLTEITEFTLLKGGLGGKGNVFYKSSVNQAPTIAQKGMPGQEIDVQLELKLLADVAIMGLPNAGKSTLISRISAARPKIADYPFTTLVPNLGVVRFADELTFVVADIPGLIAGASDGAGLGIRFLKHIERCRVFVHLIDASGTDGRDVLTAYDEIRAELSAYDRDKEGEDGFRALSPRPEIVVLNKIELLREEDLKATIAKFRGRGLEVMGISAVTGKNIEVLKTELGKRVFA